MQYVQYIRHATEIRGYLPWIFTMECPLHRGAMQHHCSGTCYRATKCLFLVKDNMIILSSQQTCIRMQTAHTVLLIIRPKASATMLWFFSLHPISKYSSDVTEPVKILFATKNRTALWKTGLKNSLQPVPQSVQEETHWTLHQREALVYYQQLTLLPFSKNWVVQNPPGWMKSAL